MKKNNVRIQILLFCFIVVCIIGAIHTGYSQQIRWLRVTPLQSPVNDIGAEFESEFTSGNSNFFSWPSQSSINQNTLRQRWLWIGCKNFNDPVEEKVKSYKVIGSNRSETAPTMLFPTQIKMIGRNYHPVVIVDDKPASDLTLYDNLDEVDANMKADRMVYVKFNTSIGVSVTKKVMAFDQSNHNNYYIYDWVFKNTGIYNTVGAIKQQTLNDCYFFFCDRYAMAGVSCTGYGQGWGAWSATWGNSQIHHTFGADPTAPAFTDPTSPLYQMRGFYNWYGPNKDRTQVTYAEDWGCPDQNEDGELASAKYVGKVFLHADRSSQDTSDDLWQPSTNNFISADINIFQKQDQYDEVVMADRYAAMTDGHPAKQHDELVGDDYPINYVDPRRQTGGGVSGETAFGPYTLAPGDSIHIVWAEGVSGISWEKGLEIGGNWLQYYKKIGTPTLAMPDGNTTTDHNLYKQKWCETGKDSILQTFRNALRNYKSGYQIPKGPPPPDQFKVSSGGDRIMLEWSSSAEVAPHFDGYVVYRSMGTVLDRKTVYEKIFECSKANVVHNFNDMTATQGFDCYYYIQTKDDGTQNDLHPGVPLYSSMFWTVTNQPARLYLISVGAFRSHQSGDWNDVNSWERFNGSVWVSPAPSIPTDTSRTITINKGHTIIVTSADSADQLTLLPSGKLVIDTNAIFILKNGFETDLKINGGTLENFGLITIETSAIVQLQNGNDINGSTINATLKNLGSIILKDSVIIDAQSSMVENYGTITAKESTVIDVQSGTVENYGSITAENSTFIRFGNRSTYMHKQNGGSIPKATWEMLSTCEITGVTNTMPSNINQNFPSFVWNCPNQSANLNLTWQNSTFIDILTILNTNWNKESTSNPSFHLSLFGADGSCHIGGLYISNNAAFTTHDGNLNDTVTITDLTVSGGSIFLLADSGGASTYYCLGNITIPDSGYIGTNDSVSQSKIIFSGFGHQYYNIPSTGVTNISRLNYQVGNSTTLMIGSSVFTGSGYFTIDSGATLEIRHPCGIDSTIRVTGTKTFKNGSSYIFDGTKPQVTGVLLPDTIGSLTIIDSAGVTLSHSVSINGLVELQKGTLSSGSNKLSYGQSGYLRYSDIYAQTTTDAEFPFSNGPKGLEIANPTGVTLHASRTIPGNLIFNLSGKLILGGSTLRANSIYNSSSSSYVVTNGLGLLILPSGELGTTLFPVGTSTAFAPVWINNTGTIDTIGVRVAEDLSKPEGGGRVKVKWVITENTPGGGNDMLKFGWMASLEDSVFKTNRITYSKVFCLSDTTEVGTGSYHRNTMLGGYTVERSGITSLGTFIVGSFTRLTDVKEYTADIPTEFSLRQNYPNPFNPSTTISFGLPLKTHVTLKIYDLLGREVVTLVSEELAAGNYTRQWNAQCISSGVYFYRIQAGSFIETKKLLILK